GSTCEMIIAKLTNILKAAEQYSSDEFVVVIDELGVGTQESSGLELGKDMLEALSKRKISVLFSTQILALAEYAKADLGAYCFKVDEHHALSVGIAGGAMDVLREKSGFNAILKKIT
ncbi:MAG: hypothetical protein AAB870_02840, partial [Patescibacteria group bacterium]